jgi:hypothetical protein
MNVAGVVRRPKASTKTSIAPTLNPTPCLYHLGPSLSGDRLLLNLSKKSV